MRYFLIRNLYYVPEPNQHSKLLHSLSGKQFSEQVERMSQAQKAYCNLKMCYSVVYMYFSR